MGPQRKPLANVVKNIVRGEVNAAELNLNALRVGLTHQAERGRIKGTSNVWTANLDAKKREDAISTSFCFSEAAFALLALRDSTDPSFANLQSQTSSLTDQMHLTLNYLCKDTVLDYIKSDSDHTNRGFFHAKTYLLCGMLLENPEATQIGEALLAIGLAKQREDGVFPEGGGHDSSYQAVSLLKLAEIYMITQRDDILGAFRRGLAWELGRITANGDVSDEGNTRCAKSPDTSSGIVRGFNKLIREHKPAKGMNYMEIARALTLCAIIFEDPTIQDVAQSVLNKSAENKGERK